MAMIFLLGPVMLDYRRGFVSFAKAEVAEWCEENLKEYSIDKFRCVAYEYSDRASIYDERVSVTVHDDDDAFLFILKWQTGRRNAFLGPMSFDASRAPFRTVEKL